MSTIVVTGATSLIGIGVVEHLVLRGDSVITLQRRPLEGLTPDVAGSVRQVTADIRDRDAVIAASRGAERLIHLAAKVGVVGTWEEYRSINVDGTANVLAAARSNGIGSVVHVSSPSVAHGGEPIAGEGATPPVTGRRRAFYAESKALAEQIALEAAGEDLGVVAVRPHLVWGPGDTQLVGRIVDRARAGRLALVGGGRALVDTTYIDNAVEALVAASDRTVPGGVTSAMAYVVSNGEPRPIRDLLDGICAAAGVPFEPRTVPMALARSAGGLVERAWPLLRRPGEPPLTRFLAEQLGTAHWFDPRPARDALGWEPTVSIDEGLRRLRAWFDTGGFDTGGLNTGGFEATGFEAGFGSSTE